MILPLRVFGSSGVKTMFAGFAIGPIFSATWLRSSSSFSTEPGSPPFSVTNATIAWPGHRVVARRDGRLGDLLVVDERRLDLDRRDAVAGDVHHVVDAAEQPEVAVGVDPGAVAREVHVAVLRPVRLAVAARRRRRCRAASPATAA